jgi:hypothetical protein
MEHFLFEMLLILENCSPRVTSEFIFLYLHGRNIILTAAGFGEMFTLSYRVNRESIF